MNSSMPHDFYLKHNERDLLAYSAQIYTIPSYVNLGNEILCAIRYIQGINSSLTSDTEKILSENKHILNSSNKRFLSQCSSYIQNNEIEFYKLISEIIENNGIPLFDSSFFIDVVAGITRKKHENLIDKLFDPNKQGKRIEFQIELRENSKLGEIKGDINDLSGKIVDDINARITLSKTFPIPHGERICDSYLVHTIFANLSFKIEDKEKKSQAFLFPPY